MSSEQIILTEADYQALGEVGERIEGKPSLAIHPMRLTDGTYALSPGALSSATSAQRAFLDLLPKRQVEHSEFQWVADAAAEQN